MNIFLHYGANHVKKDTYLLFILVFCLLPLMTNAKEMVCNIQSSDSYAFANVSPLIVFKDERLVDSTYIEIDFGQPISVVKKNDGVIQICISNNAYWAKASYLTLLEKKNWLLLNPNKAKVRPKVSLWRSRERLAAYLTGNAVRSAPLDYIESTNNIDISKVMQIPVFKKGYMEMRIGSRQVEVAGLLIYFPMTALKKYKEIKRKIAADEKREPTKITVSRTLTDKDFKDVENIFIGKGAIPILPANLREDDLVTPPAYVNEGSSWFSIPLWTIINKDYLKETTKYFPVGNSQIRFLSENVIASKFDIKIVEEILDAAIVNLRTAIHQKGKMLTIKSTIDELRKMGLTEDATETIIQFEEAMLTAKSMFDDNFIQYAKKIEKLQMVNISVSINLEKHIKKHKQYSKFIHNHVFLGVINKENMINDIEKLTIEKLK